MKVAKLGAPISDAEMDSLFKDALQTTAEEGMLMQKETEAVFRRPAARVALRTKRPEVCKKPAAKVEELPTRSVDMTNDEMDAIIAPYLVMEAPRAILQKRVHSRFWTKEREAVLKSGAGSDEVRERASSAAARGVDRWKKLAGFIE